ncbi:hypothetical protein GOODEAATRI_001345 [Goodea atripinnis]|uniref:Uncharacterized protein n=1 Tax=Goodea atripinnis TaxID=208336 RepID=A0ABV0N6Z7_9TELE
MFVEAKAVPSIPPYSGTVLSLVAVWAAEDCSNDQGQHGKAAIFYFFMAKGSSDIRHLFLLKMYPPALMGLDIDSTLQKNRTALLSYAESSTPAPQMLSEKPCKRWEKLQLFFFFASWHVW